MIPDLQKTGIPRLVNSGSKKKDIGHRGFLWRARAVGPREKKQNSGLQAGIAVSSLAGKQRCVWRERVGDPKKCILFVRDQLPSVGIIQHGLAGPELVKWRFLKLRGELADHIRLNRRMHGLLENIQAHRHEPQQRRQSKTDHTKSNDGFNQAEGIFYLPERGLRVNWRGHNVNVHGNRGNVKCKYKIVYLLMMKPSKFSGRCVASRVRIPPDHWAEASGDSLSPAIATT